MKSLKAILAASAVVLAGAAVYANTAFAPQYFHRSSAGVPPIGTGCDVAIATTPVCSGSLRCTIPTSSGVRYVSVQVTPQSTCQLVPGPVN